MWRNHGGRDAAAPGSGDGGVDGGSRRARAGTYSVEERMQRLEQLQGGGRRPRVVSFLWRKQTVAAALALALGAGGIAWARNQPPADAAPVRQGFDVTPADLRFILDQIKIAEAHVRNTTPETGPCGALIGPGEDQVESPLAMLGLRTVDGSCNNLQPGQDQFGASSRLFPRLTTPSWRQFGPGADYAQDEVADITPRFISNLISDQTSTNPAAVQAAGFPVRSVGGDAFVPCDANGEPEGCVPEGETLPILNVTTDFGLSPPSNGWFVLFGQFFDHGITKVTNGGSGSVFIPLLPDDPLYDPESQTNFMILTRASALGPEGSREALNTDTPWVDLSQTYASHGSHQVFLREYADAIGVPAATGKLLALEGGLPNWQQVKDEAAAKLGLQLVDMDVHDIPVVWTDPYGNFIPGPNGYAQWMTAAGPVEGDPLDPVPAPDDVLRTGIAFLNDIAHPAAPGEGELPDGAMGPGPDGILDPQVDAPGGPADESTDDTLGTVDVCVDPGSDLNSETADTDFCGDDSTTLDIDESLDDIIETQTVCVDPGAMENTESPDLCGDNPFTEYDETADNEWVNDGIAGTPTTPKPEGMYDDELLGLHFIAGDGRVNENIGLTAVHQVFHSEHDRLVDDILGTLAANPELDAAYRATGEGTFDIGERLFQAARFVNEMEYQHLVFEEFGRKIQPGINPFQVFAFGNTDIDPAITAEFAHAVYRFGHSQLREDIDRVGPNGQRYDIPLLDGFLNPAEYRRGPNGELLTTAQAAGGIVMGMTEQVGSEIDEFVTDTLRNNLVGLPLDLAALNIARGRSEGVPSLNETRRQLNAATGDPALFPYANWIEFGDAMRYPASLVNFVAAYGRHPSITSQFTIEGRREAARIIVAPAPENGDVVPEDAGEFMAGDGAWAGRETGINLVDLWIGGLAENSAPFGGLLGSTFNHIFERQMTDLQNGDRFYYLGRTLGMNLLSQLEGNSFAELIERNTTAYALKSDVFAVSDCKFFMDSNPGIANRTAPWNSTTIQDDPDTDCNEQQLLVRRTSDNQVRYRQNNVVDTTGFNAQSTFFGTEGVDNIYAGNDNDTLLGNGGNDILDGGAGFDSVIGGEGNDRITDFAGDDVLKGGPGNDALDGGPGLDILMGGDGSDVTNGGDNGNDHILGEGDDFTLGGVGADVVFAGGGDDWIQGGNQQDLLIGDSSTFFFTDYNLPGNDVFIGQSGDDDYDGEGGDDIFIADAGLEKNAGAAGFDWVTGIFDPQPLNEDMTQLPVEPGQVGIETRSRYFEVEGISGGNFDDILLGDNDIPVENGGGEANGFVGCDALDTDGIARITGLDQLVTPAMMTVDAATVEANATTNYCLLEGMVWGAGNVMLGGLGSDLVEGRGGDDIIDGDRYLTVRLSVRTDVGNPATEIGSTDRLEARAITGNFGPGTTNMTLSQAVFAGLVDPGNIAIVREIITPAAGPADCDAAAPSNCDTARFSGNADEYEVTVAGDAIVISHSGGAATDGIDTLRNIEQLEFVDGVQVLEAPATPTGVAATAGLSSATVSWAEDADVFPAVASYTVTVLDATDAAAPVTVRTVTVPAPATSVVVDGLTPGVAYRFTVAAVNAVGTSAPSAQTASVVPFNLPGAPTNVVATAAGATANVTWAAPAGPVFPAVGQYTVRIFDAGNTVVQTLTVAAPGTSAAVTGLGVGTYTASVSATNTTGEGPQSARSAAFTITNPIVLTPNFPAAGATSVPRASNITATFDRNVVGVVTGLNSTNVILERVSDGARIPANVTYAAATRTVTINPTPTLASGTEYRVRVLAGSCTPATGIRSGNPCVAFGGSSWTFTTVVNVAPFVSNRNPAAGATGFDRDANIVVTMSEPVTGVSALTVRLVRVSNGAAVTGSVTVNAAGVITINPTLRLPAGVQYRVTVGQELLGFQFITDQEGLPMAAPDVWTFTTGAN